MVNGIDTELAAEIEYVLAATELFCCAQTFEVMNGVINVVGIANSKGIDLEPLIPANVIDYES